MGGVAAGAAWLAAPAAAIRGMAAHARWMPMGEALLTDADGQPFNLSRMQAHEVWVFTYPYVSTPNLLVDVGTRVGPVDLQLPDGTAYRWPGGVGPRGSVVAYIAICPHAYSYLRPDAGVVGYRAPEGGRGPRVVCCAHLSTFDPLSGGAVLGGPAPHALAAVALAYDEASGKTYATGFLGDPHLDDFFRAQGASLREQFRSLARARAEAATAVVVPYSQYTRRAIHCPAER